MQRFLSTETLIIELLLIASLVAIVVRRLRIPYTVALVIVGLLLTLQSPLNLELTPELLLALFLPPLIFEAAFHINFFELRDNLPTLLILAIPGVILTTLIVGGLLTVSMTLKPAMALVFGALIAATDPVSVVALFRIIGVPKRLSVLLEGESLFNDGTAIVVYNLVLVFALTGQFDILDSVGDFIRVSVGGLTVGFVTGWLISRIIARVDDYLIETTLTTVLAYGSYLAAEQLHFSGVLAVVAAGLINGNIGSRGMSPTTRIVLFNFWEYVAFLVNSLVFLLIGLQVDIPSLLQAWQPILWAIFAIIIARVIVVFGLGQLVRKFVEPISIRWQCVITWGGLRGAVSLALVLGLPLALKAEGELMRTMAFGVVLFTLLVQATTMNLLVKRLKIVARSEGQIEYETRHARLVALRAAEAHLERRYQEGLISHHAWELIKPKLSDQSELLAEAVREVVRADPILQAEELDIIRREILRAERGAYHALLRDGVISDDVHDQLVAEVDAMLEESGEQLLALPEASLPQRLREGISDQVDVQEYTVGIGSKCDGKEISKIPWPRNFVIASLLRDQLVLIPRGETVLQAGDIIVAVTNVDVSDEVRKLTLTYDVNETNVRTDI